MPLKITVVDQLGENVLHKDRNRAGIEAELFLISRHKVLGEHHIADAQGRRNGLGEGIQIDHVIAIGQRKQRFGRFGGYGKFGFKIVFDDEPVRLRSPFEIFMPL